MQITEVRIKPVGSEGRLLAFASITIDDCFAVHNLKVIDGRDGLFVAMPSRRLLDGSHKDIAHPVNNKTRKSIEDRVLEEYHKMVKEGGVSETRVSQEPKEEEDPRPAREPRPPREPRPAREPRETPPPKKNREPVNLKIDFPPDEAGVGEEEDDDSFWATI